MNVIDTGPTLSAPMRERLTLSFIVEVIRKAMWSIADDKAPGLDGYNSRFYKAMWSVVGPDVVIAIQNFFVAGRISKAWILTTITLIPKISSPSAPGDYRLISYCHVI